MIGRPLKDIEEFMVQRNSVPSHEACDGEPSSLLLPT